MHIMQLTPTPIGKHVLPDLPYSYDALEPIIDERTLIIHHDKHHKKYVDDLNKAEISAQKMRQTADYCNINLIEAQLAFNGSGHILHSIYWTIMTKPDMGGAPGPATTELINGYFGSIEACKAQFIAAASKVFGSGWSILGFNPYFKHLEILHLERHENLTQISILPILVCDVWEHAYYLKYQNNRDEYINSWWRLINWDEVERRLIYAVQTKGVLDLGR